MSSTKRLSTAKVSRLRYLRRYLATVGRDYRDCVLDRLGDCSNEVQSDMQGRGLIGRVCFPHRSSRVATRTLYVAVLVWSALFCWPAPGGAEPPSTIGVELNRLEDQGGNCRAYLVITNPGSAEFSGFALDLVVFDRGGTIMHRLAVDVAPLRPRRPASRCSTSRRPCAAPSAAFSSTMSSVAATKAATSQGASIGCRPPRRLRFRC